MPGLQEGQVTRAGQWLYFRGACCSKVGSSEVCAKERQPEVKACGHKPNSKGFHKGEVRNAILSTKGKTVVPSFLVCNTG